MILLKLRTDHLMALLLALVDPILKHESSQAEGITSRVLQEVRLDILGILVSKYLSGFHRRFLSLSLRLRL